MKLRKKLESNPIATTSNEGKAIQGNTTITWSPWIAAILLIVSFLVAVVIAQLLVSIYPAVTHMNTEEANTWLENSAFAQFAFSLLAYGLLLLPLALFVKIRGVSFKTFGLKRPTWRDPLFGLGLLIPYYASYFIIVAMVSVLVPGLDTNQEQQVGFQQASGPGMLLLAFLALAVIPPVVEEIAVRGFLYTSLRAKLKLPLAVIITSAVFAMGHLQFGSGAPLLWIAAIDTFTLSLFLIYLREKTGSIWASITLHALKNSVAFLYLFILHKG